MIGFEARAEKLKRMLKITEHALEGKEQSQHFVMPQVKDVQLPSQSVLLDLVKMSSELKAKIVQIYQVSQPTLQQIKSLRTKKENIQKLVDVVTSIIQIKRLSYGLGATPNELLSNIKNYIQLKSKVLFCDKYLTAIDNDLEKIRVQYKQQFDRAIKESNSQNLELYSKILSLIPDKTTNGVRSLEGLVELYCNEMKKQQAPIEKELFDIPIEAAVIDDKYDYKFFEIVNNTLKIFVNKLKIYQENTRRLYGEENILHLIVELIEKILNPLLSEIFKRQVRYFSVGKYEKQNKDARDIQKLKHFVSEFGSITNQIQRFIIYLNENSIKQIDSAGKNRLEQAVNFSSLIEMNTCLIENSKQLIRLQVNYLYTESQFVSMIHHFNKQLKKKIESQNVLEIKSSEQFLDQVSLIFKRGVTRACKTINPMIVLSIIDFEASILSSDSAFSIFAELVDKHLGKATIGSPSQLALVIILNCLAELPLSIKKQLENIKIPAELNKQQIQTQLVQLKSSNSRKVKEQLRKYCLKIVNLPHFSNLLETDYKQLISGWSKLHKSALEIFIECCCEVHAYKLLQSIKRKKIDNLSLLAFQKQVRAIINQYQTLSSSMNVFGKFKMVMTLISILPIIDNTEELKKFTRDLSEREQEQINQIVAERKK